MDSFVYHSDSVNGHLCIVYRCSVLVAETKSLTVENIVLLAINGVLNVLWCLVFFTLKANFLGNVIIVVNVLFAIRLLFEICKESSVYGLWLSIYPIWLSVAATLNLAV